jgi:sortase A
MSVMAWPGKVRQSRLRTLRPKLRRSARPATAARPLSATQTIVAWLLLVVAGLTLWFVLYGLVFSRLQESRGQQELYARFREQLALATAPTGAGAKIGAPVALISAPVAGLSSAVVVEGTTGTALRDGPGHRRDSVLPGQPGVSVIYGKSVTFGGPFKHVDQLAPGAAIDVTTGQGTMHFVVDRVRHDGDPLPAPPAAGESRLTLVTAASSGWLGPWTAHSSVFVDATLHGKAQPAAATAPTAISSDEQPMASSTSSLTTLVFCLQGLLLAAVGLTWARSRWGRWQTWMVGIPVLLALLWVTTDTTFGLLPNLL